MTAFEAIGVATAMPAIAKDLQGLHWYGLAFAGGAGGALPAMVWAGQDCDRHGPFRAMAFGLLVFLLGLIIAGLSQHMGQLIVGRVLQGLGTGALNVAVVVAMARVLPAELMPQLFASFSAAWVVPAIIGPALSGWIVRALGWSWVFLSVAVLILPTAALVMPQLRTLPAAETTHRSPGAPMIWAVVAALCCIALALAEQSGPWRFALTGALLVITILAARQLLPTGVLRFAAGLPTVIALRGLIAASFFLTEAFIPLWLHQVCGWSLDAAGLALSGGALSWSVGSTLQSRVHSELARRRLLLTGGCIFAVSVIASMAPVLGWASPKLLVLSWAVSGLGVGLALPMLSVLMLRLAQPAEHGRYAAALQISAALATGTALAVGGVMFAALQAQSLTSATLAVFALAGVLALIALIFLKRVWRAP